MHKLTQCTNAQKHKMSTDSPLWDERPKEIFQINPLPLQDSIALFFIPPDASPRRTGECRTEHRAVSGRSTVSPLPLSTITPQPQTAAPPPTVALQLPTAAPPPPTTVALLPITTAGNNPSWGMDEPTTLCPSGGSLMALLGSFDAATQVPRVEAPLDELVPPLQPTSQDDARVQGAGHFDPGDGFHTPKKSPINPTSNVCYALFLFVL
jgi:hypothetical protein